MLLRCSSDRGLFQHIASITIKKFKMGAGFSGMREEKSRGMGEIGILQLIQHQSFLMAKY